MFLNLWSYKAVRHRYSNPMIQPELEGSTQGYPLVSVKVLRKTHTLDGNHVKKILLKLNLPDDRSILTDSQGTPTKHGRITKPYSSPRFIANCFIARYLKMEVKRRKELQERCIIKALQVIKSRKILADLRPPRRSTQQPHHPHHLHHATTSSSRSHLHQPQLLTPTPQPPPSPSPPHDRHHHHPPRHHHTIATAPNHPTTITTPPRPFVIVFRIRLFIRDLYPFVLIVFCHLAILCLDQHAHTLHHLESLLTISLDRLDILKEDLVYQSLRKSLSLCLSFLDS
nr:hypothetical protein [Tanacetum cinerariifolium]